MSQQSAFKRNSGGYWIQKRPAAVKDYTIDFADWLAEVSDTIATCVWAAATGVTASSPTNTDTTATIWLSGGTDAQSYLVTCTITTVGGRTEQIVFRLVIRS